MQQLGHFSSCVNIGDSILYIELGICQLSSTKYALVFNMYKYKAGAKSPVSVFTHEHISTFLLEVDMIFFGGGGTKQEALDVSAHLQDATSSPLANIFIDCFGL